MIAVSFPFFRLITALLSLEGKQTNKTGQNFSPSSRTNYDEKINDEREIKKSELLTGHMFFTLKSCRIKGLFEATTILHDEVHASI